MLVLSINYIKVNPVSSFVSWSMAPSLSDPAAGSVSLAVKMLLAQSVARGDTPPHY